jgi:CRISPR-associated protein Csb2
MTDTLCLSFRFLAPWFHGRRDGGAPEWPPSPMRAFQAMVAGASRLGRLDEFRPAFRWLETLSPPEILAPEAVEASGYRLSVPNNSMDIVARGWVSDSESKETNPATHRTMKGVRPMHFGEQSEPFVHYLWALPSGVAALTIAPHLIAAVRAVVSLGWGLDLVIGNGAILSSTEVAHLSRAPEGGRALERWRPIGNGGRQGHRAPLEGTLADLDRRHAAFTARASLDSPVFAPPPPATVYQSVEYTSESEFIGPPCTTFTLLRPDSESMSGRDPMRQTAATAGRLRHATDVAARRAGWDVDRIRALVLGHGEARGSERQTHSPARFIFAPLPSVEARGGGRERVGLTRRVLVAAIGPGADENIAWARRSLSGAELVDEASHATVAVLAQSGADDRVAQRYLTRSDCWATVTPVVLPGRDDRGGIRKKLAATRDASTQKLLLARLAARTDALLRKAFVQAGLTEELVTHAQLEFRAAGYLPGVELASRYTVPSHLIDFPRVHVRVRWLNAEGLPLGVYGPLCVGRGRFYGLGLFVGQPGADGRPGSE